MPGVTLIWRRWLVNVTTVTCDIYPACGCSLERRKKKWGVLLWWSEKKNEHCTNDEKNDVAFAIKFATKIMKLCGAHKLCINCAKNVQSRSLLLQRIRVHVGWVSGTHSLCPKKTFNRTSVAEASNMPITYHDIGFLALLSPFTARLITFSLAYTDSRAPLNNQSRDVFTSVFSFVLLLLDLVFWDHLPVPAGVIIATLFLWVSAAPAWINCHWSTR